MSIKIVSFIKTSSMKIQGFYGCGRKEKALFRSMDAQQCSFWLKIRAAFYDFLGASYIWFWILGSQKSNITKSSWFEVEMREIWPFEVNLCKGYAIMGLNTGPIHFSCLGSSFYPLFGLESCWIGVAIQELPLATFDTKYWCQVEDNWLWFTIGKLWKLSPAHEISFEYFIFFMHIVILHEMRSIFLKSF